MNQSAQLLGPTVGSGAAALGEGEASRAHLASVIILKINECGRTPGPVRNGTARQHNISIGDRFK